MKIQEIITEEELDLEKLDRPMLLSWIQRRLETATDPASIKKFQDMLAKFGPANPSRYLSNPLEPMPASGRGVKPGNHLGRDIPVQAGTYVIAPESGTVSDAGNDDPDGKGIERGGFVILQTSTGEHQFFHLSEVMSKPGKKVHRGQVLGKSGGQPGKRGSGYSTGPHLHWEYRIKGEVVDPLSYLR
jgi:murein DD-endopeptidase MepM/ murein hydrolase activator NlpD